MESRLIVKIEGKEAERDAKRLANALDQLGKEGDDAARSTDKVGQSAKKSAGTLSRMKSALGLASKALAGLTAGAGAVVLATSRITNMTDAVAQMKGELKLATGSQQAANAAFKDMLELANSTGQSLEATTSLYARMSRATEQLGTSQETLLSVTKAINQSFIVSGAAQQEAAAATLQFSQGLASGTLRGEELNSVMENSPRLAQALAEGLGRTRGELREMGAAGELTADQLIEALSLMAGSIEKDFEQMPKTVGRSMQVMRNTLMAAFEDVDVSNLNNAISDVSAAMQDPKFKAAVDGLAESFIGMTAQIVEYLAKFAEFAQKTGEFFAKMRVGPGGESTTAELVEELQKATDQVKELKGHWFSEALYHKRIARLERDAKKLTDQLTATGDTLELVNGKWVLHTQTTERSSEMSDRYNATIERGKEAHKKLADALALGEKVLGGYADRTKELQEENQEYIDGLEEELRLLGLTDREREIAIALKGLDENATEAMKNQTIALATAIYHEREAIRAQEDALKAAADQADPWADAMVHAVERIDAAFADLWVGVFQGFENMADRLKASMEQWLAELAHAAISRPILLNLTAAMGFGGATTANAAAATPTIFSGISAAGGVIPWLNGGATSLGSSLISGGNYLMGGGFGTAGTEFGRRLVGTGTNFAAEGWLGSSGLLANAGAGFAGGLLGNQVFGDTSGWGSTGGALAGTVFGMGNPLFTGLGAFFGAGAEKILGDVLGFGGKGGNQAGRAEFDLSTGTGLTAYGVGKSYDEKNVQGVQAIVDMLAGFSELVGGSSFRATIKQGNRSGLKMDGVRYDSVDELLVKAFDDILDSADNLAGDIKVLARAFEGTAAETVEYTQALLVIDDIITGSSADISEAARALMLNFDGTAEEMVRFSMAMTVLYEMLETNPVDQAVKDFAEGLKRASMTMTDAYLDQLMGVAELIDTYDGSLESTEALTRAMAQNRQMAYDLAIAIQAVSKEISGITEGEAEFYRTSQFDDAELRAYRESQRDELMAALSTSIDPNEIRELVSNISQINRDIFRSMSEEEQAREAENFAVMAEEVGAMGQERLELAMGIVEDTQNHLIASVDDMLANHIEGMADLATRWGSAVQLFAGVVQNLQLQGIRVRVDTRAGEVNG